MCFGLAQDAQAQFSIGAYTGYNLDAPSEDGFEEGALVVGGQARFQLPGVPLILNPAAEYVATGIENASVWQFDANVLYPFGVSNAVFTPYAGLGLGVTRVSFDEDASVLALNRLGDETDYGLNIIGGATFGMGPIQPFAQARITLGEHTAFLNEDGEGGPGYALTGGVLFKLGR